MPLSQAPVGGGVVDRIRSILVARHVTLEDFLKASAWDRSAVQRLFKQGVASPVDLVTAFPVILRFTGMPRAELLEAILAIAVPNTKETVTRLVVERMAKEGLDANAVARHLKTSQRVVMGVLRGGEPTASIRPAMATWLGVGVAQLEHMSVLQRTRKIAPTLDEFVQPLSTMIVDACMEQTKRERNDAAERSRRSSSDDDDTDHREAKALKAAARIPDYSPSSWARKHGLSVRVISALANGETLTQKTMRSKTYGLYLAKKLGIDETTFWTAMRRNRVMPTNAWSGEIQRRLREAYDAQTRTVQRGDELIKVPETMRTFAERVGVHYDTLFHLMDTGDLAGVLVVNREKIRRFLGMGHEEWFAAIKVRSANGLAVPRHSRTQVSMASMADGDDEVRLLTLWRRAERVDNGAIARNRILQQLSDLVHGTGQNAKAPSRKTRSHAD